MKHPAKIEPLITSAEVYPLLETMAARAKRRLLFSFRIFDTRTKLRTDEVRDRAGGDDWAALLIALASSGVDVRLQISDFDPIGGPELHRDAWASLKYLNEIAGSNSEARNKIEVMAARHPAAVGSIWRRLFRPRALREVDRIDREHQGDTAEQFPGLADVLKGATPHLYPATHHQKLSAIDDDFALIGGLDVDERRWDTPEHDRPAEETWRDISLAVYGAPSGHVALAASQIWNRCAKDFAADQSPKPSLPYLLPPTPRSVTINPQDGGFSVCMTASDDARGMFSFGPRNTDDSTLKAVLEMIRSAKEFIYIETQYFRSTEVALALVSAAKVTPNLQLIMVLPFAPDEVAFEGMRGGAMRHAEALQVAAVEKIQKAFSGRLALLSPAKPTRRDHSDSFVAYGAGIIYVHSKVLIIDGADALVGSANLNDRSLQWDTEVSARWTDPEHVIAFYDKIGASWLNDVAGPLGQAKTWRDAAEQNASVAPDLREGFLLPYQTTRARRFSKRAFWLPDALF